MDKTNIVLAGFMYSGKSTIGELVARSTGRRLVDTDEMIERETGSTVSEIFAGRGESAFRDLERSVVERVAGGGDLVIALGGGALMDEANVEKVTETGVVYYLALDADEVVRRAAGSSGRPLLDGKSVEGVKRLLDGRRDAYLRAADLIVETAGREPGEIADEIARDFNQRKGRDQGDA
jgi:shikimate kinase